MVQLVEICTGAGWNTLMFSAIDATKDGQGPSFNNAPTFGIYFVSLIILGRYLMLTLYTGVYVTTCMFFR